MFPWHHREPETSATTGNRSPRTRSGSPPTDFRTPRTSKGSPCSSGGSPAGSSGRPFPRDGSPRTRSGSPATGIRTPGTRGGSPDSRAGSPKFPGTCLQNGWDRLSERSGACEENEMVDGGSEWRCAGGSFAVHAHGPPGGRSLPSWGFEMDHIAGRSPAVLNGPRRSLRGRCVPFPRRRRASRGSRRFGGRRGRGGCAGRDRAGFRRRLETLPRWIFPP